MKNFLKNIIILFGMLVIVNVPFKMYLDKLYISRYYKIDLNKNTYLLADSHGLPIKQFDNQNIYNFSFGSDSYVDMAFKLKYLIKNSKIEMLVLTADDHVLSPYRDLKNNNSLSSVLNTTVTKEKVFNFFKNNFVLISPEYGSLLKFHIALNLSNEKPVTIWENKSKDEKVESANHRFGSQLNYDTSSKPQINALLNIIELCRKNEIKLIGIKFPISEEYRNIIGTNTFSPDSIFKHYDVPLLNFKENFLEKDKFFRDQDHLNDLGGILLKEALEDSIKVLKTRVY